MKTVQTRIRRWAFYLPDGLVILSILLLGLILVGLMMAAITLALLQSLRLAGDDVRWIGIISGIILVLGIALVLPMIVVFASFVGLLEWYIGERCPSCRRMELEWQSGHWTYGEPPNHRYFACTSCGATFRRLYGGQGVLSELERV